MGMNTMGINNVMMGQHMMNMPQNMQQNMQQNINFQNPISGNIDGTPIDLLRSDLKQSQNNFDSDINNDNESVRIKKLVNDINDDLRVDSDKSSEKSYKSTNKNLDDIDSDSDSDSESHNSYTKKNNKQNKQNKQSKQKLSGLVDTLFDAALLFVIYMLMSQHFIKSFIGTYINSINPNSEGYVSNFGVAVYGLIFIIIFVLSKMLVNKMA